LIVFYDHDGTLAANILSTMNLAFRILTNAQVIEHFLHETGSFKFVQIVLNPAVAKVKILRILGQRKNIEKHHL